MDLNPTQEQSEFAEGLRTWLRAKLPTYGTASPPAADLSDRVALGRSWQRELAEARSNSASSTDEPRWPVMRLPPLAAPLLPIVRSNAVRVSGSCKASHSEEWARQKPLPMNKLFFSVGCEFGGRKYYPF